MESFRASASAGGPAGLQALLAAAAAGMGLRSVARWLTVREFAWVTPRRVTVATSLAVSVAAVVVVQVTRTPSI